MKSFLRSSLVASSLCLAAPLFAQDEIDIDATAAGDVQAEPNPLATEPQTPEEFFEASLLTLKLARTDLAKYYMEGLLKMEPDDDVLLKLRTKHGTATFLELARNKALEPHGRDLLTRINEASLRRINDPGALSELIDKLDGSTRDREDALQGLGSIGPDAVPALIRTLGDTTSTVDPNAIIYALKRLGRPAVAPLVGCIQGNSTGIRVSCLDVLGESATPDDAIYLWAAAFDPAEDQGVQVAAKQALAQILFHDPSLIRRVTSTGATRKLQTAANQHLRDEQEWPVDDEGLTTVWVWSPEDATVVAKKVTPHRASLYIAERLVRDSLRLSTTDEQAQLQLVSILMARDIEAAGWDQPIPGGPGTALDLAVTAGPEFCEKVLAASLKDGNIAASLTSLSALAQVGSRKMLRGKAETPAVVISALDAPDQRIQWAAATAILTWQPDAPFRSSRRVVEILARELNADGAHDVVVTDPNSQRGVSLAALFGELGYDEVSVVSGRDGFAQCAARGDVALTVLHLNTVNWTLTPTIANLRADSRTARLPILITGPADMRCTATKLIKEYPHVFYLNDPNDASDVQQQLQQHIAKITPPPLTEAQQTSRIKEAAGWLQTISTGKYAGTFDVSPAEAALSDGINNPLIARESIVALATIGTAAAQSRLLDVALAPAMDASLRVLAARSLSQHIRNHGLTIPESQLVELEQRFRDEQHPQTRSALGAILGSVQPKPETVSHRLLSFPASTGPIE